MESEERKKQDVFLKELIEAKMDNAIDKYHLSKYWYFHKKTKETEISSPNTKPK